MGLNLCFSPLIVVKGPNIGGAPAPAAPPITTSLVQTSILIHFFGTIVTKLSCDLLGKTKPIVLDSRLIFKENFLNVPNSLVRIAKNSNVFTAK